MKVNQSLIDPLQAATYIVGGNAPRFVQELKNVLDQVDGNLVGDTYGSGKMIEDFQNQMAAYLGKESAVFFPSGTMAQQIALRIWCDELRLPKVAYHPLCHLEIHEQDGLKELHHIQPILLADKDRLITLDDVVQLEDNISCLLLELPQREIGGQLPAYSELEAISAYCRDKGIKLHLDGARLFEITPYYQRSVAEICALFDSVYVSFYKGIGGIAGAILAGDTAFTEKSKVWKRRHGGDLISLYPYILSSKYYFDQRIDKMGQYYEGAKELAAIMNQCEGIQTKPIVPVSNMFHVHMDYSADVISPILAQIYEETGVGLTGYLIETSDKSCSFELSIGDRYSKAPKDKLNEVFRLLEMRLKVNGN
ncbi:beta-eliminating lyase-related protein [Paenibacillus sp. N1-5-1-14]|uniref:threonine aldolase family protein n=1 Tax=Paenibacillus radicibacter TaxID=2972488 RepID=UPI002159394A|nr:beta-eliminating lyase-related protein [Paenibacillus radicibacter]MCR8641741.1 beta-eliminating lyase-related protein [Paenibacillus radicibacter]